MGNRIRSVRPRLVGVNDDVISLGIGREEPIDAHWRSSSCSLTISFQQLAGVVKELAGSGADSRIGKDAGYLPLSSHAMKKGDQSMYGTIFTEREVAEQLAHPGTRGGDCRLLPVDGEAAFHASA